MYRARMQFTLARVGFSTVICDVACDKLTLGSNVGGGLSAAAAVRVASFGVYSRGEVK
jgi:hypothetical protein